MASTKFVPSALGVATLRVVGKLMTMPTSINAIISPSAILRQRLSWGMGCGFGATFGKIGTNMVGAVAG